MEPDHGSVSRAWSWRHALGKSGLPSNTRLVLHTLGLKMDASGGSCFPPISEIVELSGLDKKTVLKHLELAEEKGWIEVSQHGFRGQKWKRNEYVARWPGRDLIGETLSGSDRKGGGATPPRSDAANTAESLPEGSGSIPPRSDEESLVGFSSEGGGAVPPPSEEKVVELSPEGGGTVTRKVVEHLHQDKNLPANSPTNSPSAGAGERWNSRDSKKIGVAFVDWFASLNKHRRGSEEYARNAWRALSAEERAECIERTPAYLRWASPSELMAAAIYLKNRHWRDMPEQALAEPVQTRGIAKVCGKLWVGSRLRALSKEPTGLIVLTTFDKKEIADGRFTRDEVLRKKRMENGWPYVTNMTALARRGEPFVTTLELVPFVASFRQVERGSALFLAWEALHERRGWQFIEKPREYTWFPAVDEQSADLDGAVEAALLEFLTSIEEGKGNDHAA